MTVQAIAAGTVGGTTYAASSRASAKYNIMAVAPTFSPAGGAYKAAQTVTLTTATTGASIYFTTDGSEPSTSSTLYTGPLSVTVNTTIKAIAAGTVGGITYAPSARASATYTITP
jgi:hypothetical protein